MRQRSLRRQGLARSFVEDGEGELVGVVGVFRGHTRDVLEIGYWLAEAKWGRGYATEMVRGGGGGAPRSADGASVRRQHGEPASAGEVRV